MRALLRRPPALSGLLLKVADLKLNRVERTLQWGDKRIELTSNEFGLLKYLVPNEGHRLTGNMIVEHVWNLSFDTGPNLVDA